MSFPFPYPSFIHSFLNLLICYLAAHIKGFHLGIRDHFCAWPGCSFATTYPSNLNRHWKRHIEKEKEKKKKASTRLYNWKKKLSLFFFFYSADSSCPSSQHANRDGDCFTSAHRNHCLHHVYYVPMCVEVDNVSLKFSFIFFGVCPLSILLTNLKYYNCVELIIYLFTLDLLFTE